MTTRRILVTGASGSVGREVVRACASAQLIVRCAGRAAPADTHESAPLDFERPATWPAALADCHSVFLLRPPALADMQATLNPFIDAAYQHGVEHVVFLSVSGAERMSWVPHRKVELHLESRGLGYTLLRPGFFAQNFEAAYLADIVEDSRVYVPAAAGRVAFLDVADIGDIAAVVLRAPSEFRGRALTLTGPEAVTFGEAASTLSQILGRPVRYEPATLAGYAWHLRQRRRLPWTQVFIQSFLHYGLRRGDAESVAKTTQELLGRPARPLGAYFERRRSVWDQASK